MSIATFWSEDRWTRAFGYRPGPPEKNPYTLGYHIGQDVAAADWFVGIPAIRDGVVVASGRSGLIGGYVTLRAADGLYDTYCHLHSGNLPTRGETIRAGQGIARPARSKSPSAGHDYMGSASSGPHQHFVVSRRISTPWAPVAGDVVDPRPIIRAALVATAADSSKPFVPITPEMIQEDPMRYALILHVSSNQLLVVDMFEKKIVNLGNNEASGVRAYYSMMKYAKVEDAEWEKNFPLKDNKNPDGFTYVFSAK